MLVFVHGLGGDATSTWGDFERLIKEDSNLHDHVESYFFGYPTKPMRFWQRWRSLRTQDISRALRTEIDNRFPEHDQILLICHSLGGLVAKHYICETIKSRAPLKVKGVIFFATPHTGAAMAALADRLSVQHFHLRQLRPDSDFIDLVTEDWSRLDCESQLETTYVVGGQDAIVDRLSAGPPGTSPHVVAAKGHGDLVKPSNDTDISYLIVKRTVSRLFLDNVDDIESAREALRAGDTDRLIAQIAGRGRSWIETTYADAAVEMLQEVARSGRPGSAEVIWSRYFIALSRLFRDGEASGSAFSNQLIADADKVGLAPLILGEVMEFARKRDDRDAAKAAANALLANISGVTAATNAGNAYALGTAYFLLGNLYRFGGRYPDAQNAILKARTFYRPAILSHQIELAHCHYALAVCRAMQGTLRAESIPPLTLGIEFHRFADALITLALSHSAWGAGRLGEAEDYAERASKAFEQIRFSQYAQRARSLGGLLGAWNRLEFGTKVEKAIVAAPAYATVIRGMVGDEMSRDALRAWISQHRPSSVLGMLQFGSAYSADWTANIGEFSLPPLLSVGETKVEWHTQKCHSLHEANVALRAAMGIGLEVRVPLIAD